eukprot:6717905-Prymnesium_polylepis.2
MSSSGAGGAAARRLSGSNTRLNLEVVSLPSGSDLPSPVNAAVLDEQPSWRVIVKKGGPSLVASQREAYSQRLIAFAAEHDRQREDDEYLNKTKQKRAAERAVAQRRAEEQRQQAAAERTAREGSDDAEYQRMQLEMRRRKQEREEGETHHVAESRALLAQVLEDRRAMHAEEAVARAQEEDRRDAENAVRRL